MNAPQRPVDTLIVAGGTDPTPHRPGLDHPLVQNTLKNFERWIAVLAPPPRAKFLRPTLPAVAGALATIYVVIGLMFAADAAATDWAQHLPQGVRDVFERITNFGLSGWFLVPFGFAILALAVLITPKLSSMSRKVLTALAARFGFLFLAVGVPGLFVAIVKRMIGRARPSVGGHDDPFLYMPFIWKPQYASMPSGHSTTAAAAAIAIGALWPRWRGVMWVYVLLIMLSRVIVIAHHPSDVIAGTLVGTAGACLVRRWFVGRRLLFCPTDLRPYPGPSWRRIVAALREALQKLSLSY